MTATAPCIVAIGASWGGLKAMRTLLAGLPADLGASVVVVQHRSADSSGPAYVELLQKVCKLPIIEIDDKERIVPDTVFVAPADYHTLIETGHFALSRDIRVQYARPSIDVLFESAADAYGDEVLAVVLTGANQDGADGVLCVKRAGGYTIVQDPETSERPEMPRAAIGTGVVDEVLTLDEVAPRIVALCTNGKVRP